VLDSPMTGEIHSRSLLAGYLPELLHSAAVVIAGAGALGQNVAQNLALSGVGKLLLVDFDVFEAHNATRSPFFPTADEFTQFKGLKAPIVAHRCAQISTAPDPEVRYSTELVQHLGDAAISWADIVISAVDNVTARAWLAERCRLHGKPMAEGGFSGPSFNFSVFSAESGRACYRCHNPYRESSASCTRYALEAEARNLVPAIQSTAAVLGGWVAEHVIQVLHGAHPAEDERFYGDLRRSETHRSTLQANPRCPGEHEPAKHFGRLDVPGFLGDLPGSILKVAGPGRIVLAEPFHLSFPCTSCGLMCDVKASESTWLLASRCVGCGGPWPLSSASMPASVRIISVPEDLAESSPLTSVKPVDIGVRPSGSMLYESAEQGRGFIDFTGDADAFTDRAAR
jgi:molybdopterin/thiamine biosynthesis adenylyltransferase